MSKFGEIYESIKDVSDAEIRISPDETVYIINLTAKEAEKVLAATDDGAETLFEVPYPVSEQRFARLVCVIPRDF